MSDKETLHFKIGLSGTSTTKQPEFQILVNNTVYINQFLTQAPGETEFFEFDAEVNEGDCSLKIVFLNKLGSDTTVGPNGEIQSDLLLNIDAVEIDEIDLGMLKWSLSKYLPIYPDDYQQIQKSAGIELADELSNTVNLGWNGSWILPFQSPFYIWLLENI